MPPKKSDNKKRAPSPKDRTKQIKYEGGFFHIAGSKSNAVRLKFKINTCPYFIKSMMCGSKSEVADPNPYDTATAAALV